MISNIRKLNLGCGADIKKGYKNIDIKLLKSVDLICDLEKSYYPFKEEVHK